MKKTALLLLCLFYTIVTQAQVVKTVNCTAGHLSEFLNSTELSTVTDLTLTGTIDARDFKTMRDSMPVLAVLDMGSATITAYTGTLGTNGAGNITYPANFIPYRAFTDPITSAGKLSLTSIIMPSTTTSIGYVAFANCTGITSATIPASVTTIGQWAFSYCIGLSSLDIPPLVNTIEANAFSYCSGLTTISIPASLTSIGSNAFSGSRGQIIVASDNPNYSTIDDVLFDKTQTILIQCPASKNGDYIIPSSVITIDSCAFLNCTGLTSITIPASVTTIQGHAFRKCNHLTSLYTYVTTPVDLSASPGVFYNDSLTKCVLYIPSGSLAAYHAANQWSDFSNIEEYTLAVSFNTDSIAKDANSKDSVSITSNTSWTPNSNETWLTVSPASGTGNGKIVFTAEANTAFTTRQATITISASGVSSKTIVITQKAVAIILSVSANTASIANLANSKDSVDVTSNTAWTASSDESWLTVSTASDSGNGKIVFTAEANTAITTRQATITISATGVTSKTITITQDAAAITLSVSANTANISYLANSKDSVDVTSNTFWTASADKTWLTVGPASDSGNGKIVFTAEANTAITTRQATITISATGVTSKTITITQDAAAIELFVSANTVSISKLANSKDSVDITSNTSWTASSDKTWLTVNPASGTGNDEIVFTAEANAAITTRQATVTISATGVTSKTITITQDEGAATLSLSISNMSVIKDESSGHLFQVYSNTDWTATSNKIWLTFSSSASGTGNGSITFKVEANTTNTAREATITVSATGVASKTVILTQDPGTEVGVSVETTENVNIFPNPAQNMLYISCPGELKQVKICTIEGRIVVSMNSLTSNSIDISDLEKGIYFVYIVTEKGTSLKKIVKE
jgi:hypothetical protein